jgi:DNA-binding transcriptional regulator YiaG
VTTQRGDKKGATKVSKKVAGGKDGVGEKEMRSVAADMKQAFAVDAGREKRLTRFTTFQVTVPPTADEVRALRSRLQLSQSGFAKVVNVGVRAVQSWEQGSRQPDGAAVTLLWLLTRHQNAVLGWLKERESADRKFSVSH